MKGLHCCQQNSILFMTTNNDNFPFIKQQGKYDCAIASLKMILAYNNFDTSIIESESTNRGTSISQLCAMANNIGFETHPIKCSIRFLQDKLDLPAIIFLDKKHYAVIYKINNSNFYVSDPLTGKTVYNYNKFSKHWFTSSIFKYGIAIAIKKTRP